MNLIEQHASDIVHNAFIIAEDFPPERSQIETFVQESIGGMLPSATDLVKAIIETGHFFTSFDAEKNSSPSKILHIAFYEAVMEEAAALVDARMEQIQEQVKDWGVIVDLFADLGVGMFTTEHDDYVFISREGIKLHKFARAVQEYIDASGLDYFDFEKIELAKQKHPAIDLPTGTDASEWEEFAKNLRELSDMLDNYVVDYGASDKKLQQMNHFNGLVESFKDNMPEFDTDMHNNMRLIRITGFLQSMIYDINQYLAIYDPPFLGG